MSRSSDDIVLRDGKRFRTIQEGLARILVPVDAPTSVDSKAVRDKVRQPNAPTVFYNPIQQFNRDLSVLAIRAFGEDLLAVRAAHKAKLDAGRRVKSRAGRNPGLLHVRQADVNAPEEGQPAGKRIKVGPSEDVVMDDGSVDFATSEIPAQTGDADAAPTETDMSIPNEAIVQPAPDEKQAVQISPTPKRGRLKILDALSATGLRALRYAHELPFNTAVTANDLSAAATASIAANVTHNLLANKITVVTGNALSHMYALPGTSDAHHHGPDKRYDVIDLDPYGTAAPFLDASVQALTDGGMLCVTCTDAGVWASCGYPEKCYALYGGTPVKGPHSHEAGLRLILQAVATSAARYGVAIEPMLSLSIDYYARVFVRVSRSPAEVKMLAGKTMLVYTCDSGCGAWKVQQLARHQTAKNKNGSLRYHHSLSQAPVASPYCEHCGHKTHLSGPMWGGPLQNPAFLQSILSYLPELDGSAYGTKARIEGMLSTALEETLLDRNPNQDAIDATKASTGIASNTRTAHKDSDGTRMIAPLDPALTDRFPFFFVPSMLAKVLHCQAPSDTAVKGALRRAGYVATRSHVKPGTIRTNAPWSHIWHVMREWVRQRAPLKEGSLKPGTPGFTIMATGSGNGRVQSTTNDGGGSVETQVEGSTPDKGDAGIDDHTCMDASGQGRAVVVFDERLGREELTSANKRLVRYQTNPRANWGPMMRARKKESKAAVERGTGAVAVADAGADAGAGAGAVADVCAGAEAGDIGASASSATVQHL